MYEISIDSLLKISDNMNIIDIRSKQKYNDNHILKAINIDKNELMLNPSLYMNKFDNYYIYCQRGITSNKLCQILRNLGYKTYSIKGGYEEWILRK